MVKRIENSVYIYIYTSISIQKTADNAEVENAVIRTTTYFYNEKQHQAAKKLYIKVKAPSFLVRTLSFPTKGTRKKRKTWKYSHVTSINKT